MSDSRATFNIGDKIELPDLDPKGNRINRIFSVDSVRSLDGSSCVVYDISMERITGALGVTRAIKNRFVLKECYPKKLAGFLKRMSVTDHTLIVHNDSQTVDEYLNPIVLEDKKTEFEARKQLFHDSLDKQDIHKYVDPNYTFAGKLFKLNNTYYVLSEYKEGDSLLINRDELQSLNSVVEVMLSICESVKRIHDNGLLNLDIKPANVFKFKDKNIISWFDLGSMQSIKDIRNQSVHIYWSHSPDYAAPELNNKDRYTICEATDIYSIGAVMFWLLTGIEHKSVDLEAIAGGRIPESEPRFANINDLCAKQNNEKWIIKEQLKIINKIFSQTLAKDVTKRYQDVSDLLYDLKALHGSTLKGFRRLLLWARVFWKIEAAVIILAISCGVLFWDQNYREKSTYFADYVCVRGVPIGIHEVNKNELGRRAYYEIVKSAGKVRKIMYKNYKEMLTEPYDNDNDPSGEFINAEFEYIGDNLGKKIYRGFSGTIQDIEVYQGNGTYINYITPEATGDSASLTGNLFGGNEDFSGNSSIRWSRVEYDENGFAVKEMYYSNKDGNQQASDINGIYGVRFIRDEKGRVIAKIYLDQNENIFEAKYTGIAAIIYAYDEHGNCVRTKHYGQDLKPTRDYSFEEDWSSTKDYEYDERGNLTKKFSLGINDELLSVSIISNDEYGNRTQMTGKDVEQILGQESVNLMTGERDTLSAGECIENSLYIIPSPIVCYDYNNNGQMTHQYFEMTPIDFMNISFDIPTIPEIFYTYNEKNSECEEVKITSSIGENQSYRYSVKWSTYTSERIRRITETIESTAPLDKLLDDRFISMVRNALYRYRFFNSKMYTAGDNMWMSVSEYEFDVRGNLVEQRYMGPNFNTVENKVVLHYDKERRDNCLGAEYLDENGAPIEIDGIARWEVEYDDAGAQLSKIYYDKSNNIVYRAEDRDMEFQRFIFTRTVHLLGANYNSENEYTKKAHEWLTIAASRSLAEARLSSGIRYRLGIGVEIDEGKALDLIQLAAEAGLAEAQVFLGDMYYKGSGVSQDYAKAVQWVRRAADQGLASAQLLFGWMYCEGKCVDKDDEKAFALVKQAIGNNFPLLDAQTSLSVIYEDGWGLEKDYAEATLELTRTAAEQGSTDAQLLLGEMLHMGWGVGSDWEASKEWFQKAAEQGLATAKLYLAVNYYKLGRLNDNEEYFKKAAEWFLSAAEDGIPEAWYNLGVLYFKGLGVEQNYDKCVEYLNIAADKGYFNAYETLGFMYKKGEGIEKNAEKSMGFYDKFSEFYRDNKQSRYQSEYIIDGINLWKNPYNPIDSHLKLLKSPKEIYTSNFFDIEKYM